MPEHDDNRGPWLIAAWPGMGNVAIIAATHLIERLGLEEHSELDPREHYDIAEITVKRGLIEPVRLPRGLFFRSAEGARHRDLIVFLGEAQPTQGVYAHARELMQAAVRMGVDQVITFASMASALHPGDNPKVGGIATSNDTLQELRRVQVEPLADGQIGGLNGVLLAAAAEFGVTGLCLLAEIPFFAANVSNPKAARVALSVFSVLSGIEVSLDRLDKQAEVVDRMLIDALERLQSEGQAPPEIDRRDEEQAEESEEEPAEDEGPTERELDYSTRQRIERLFDEARKDRNQALALKQELDRLGVFDRYEDRFLDLFRRGD